MSWFLSAERFFEKYLLPFKDDELLCLQIGVYAGDATRWMLENLPEAHIVDVDPWEGSEDIPASDIASAKDRYWLEIGIHPRLETWTQDSDSYFEEEDRVFDFIYVDGDHRAPQVLRDALSAFLSLREGGLLAFDDYFWTSPLGRLHTPKPAIDAFLDVHADHLVVLERSSQVWVQKL